MNLDENQLLKFLKADEGECLEFKSLLLDNKKIAEYAVALGNEGGGWLLIGVSDRKPRKIVGIAEQSQSDLQKIQKSVFDATSIRINICPVNTLAGYVLGIEIPARLRGQVFHTKTGKFLMRSGEELRGMTLTEINAILNEAPRTEGKAGLQTLALFEARRLRYEIEQARSFPIDWQKLNQVISKLIPYGRDFDFDVKDEVIYAASLASDFTRDGMPAETASRICYVVSESLPITNLISRHQGPITENDERLLNSALSVVHSLAWDTCRYIRNEGVAQAAANLLTVVLRYAVLNGLSDSEKEGIKIVDRLIALRGKEDKLVKIFRFAKDDALTYRGE